MNKIGFKNFRRFIDFEPIIYKDITFLVGRNNSGKSTLVKAFILIIDYLKSENVRTFSFSKTNIEDVNIVTYGRAKCKKRPDIDSIEFEMQLDNIEIKIIVSGKEDSTAIDVRLFKIMDITSGLTFELDPGNSSISIASLSQNYINKPSGNEVLLRQLQEKESELKHQIEQVVEKLSEDYISTNNELKSLNAKIRAIKKSLQTELINKDNFRLDTHFNQLSLKEILDEAILEFSTEYEMQYHDIQKGKKPKKNFENLKAFKDNKFKIQTTVSDIIKQINQTTTIYLGATLSKQSALFAIRDKNNALAQAIHEFNQLNIEPGEEAYRFVQKWMNMSEFDIGKSFTFKMHAGEAYEVLINTNGTSIPLADMGMGSIQSMLLILRLGTIIHKKQKDKNQYTIIIEEPELNLHPALQSKLADLFLEVNQKYGVKLIIETHSEYLIRKTQLLVKENYFEVEPNENPFSVLYFDKESQWEMNYREDGKFIDEFGSGFFDETRKIVKKMM